MYLSTILVDKSVDHVYDFNKTSNKMGVLKRI